MEEDVAEEAAKEAAGGGASPAAASGKPPILLVVLLIVNMAFIGGVGFMLYKNKKKENAEPKLEHVIQGEHQSQDAEAHTEKQVAGKIVPLETFIVNLAGSKGRRIAKVNMEIEVEGEKIIDEIEKRKAQIRDIIIITLSGKTYDEVATREGKEQLREEVKDTVNAFLTKGKIINVYFTDFIYN
jgi:flagellar FliL protein